MNKKAALDYLGKNISVIPCGKDKRPLIDWKVYQNRRATKEEVEKWFTQFPDAQVGIVTGKISNLIVVDIDDPKMDLSWLPKTAVVRTGSGGFHYYYLYVPGVKNKARVREKIDIRADGGFVVAPPSFNEKGPYVLLEKNQCQIFPINLFKSSLNNNNFQKKIGLNYIGFSVGSRNDEMTRFIGHLLVKIHPSEWENIAWPLVLNANQKNTPPLSLREVRAIFDSIISRERANKTDRWYKQTFNDNNSNSRVNLIVKKNYKERYTWGTRGLDTSLAIIKRGNFIIIGAKRHAGKTTFSFDMACKNALLGHKTLYLSLEMEGKKIKEDFARKYAEITIEEEYDYAIPAQKQYAFDKKIAEIDSIENLFFRGMRRGKNVNWDTIIEIINEFKELDLIFIDNLDLIDGLRGENNFDRQKRITRNLMGLTAEKQIPIVLIHHHRKTLARAKDFGSDELSGSGKVADNADIILKITRCEDPAAGYPEKYLTRVFQQKGRGYPSATTTVYFIGGTFMDIPPLEKKENIRIFGEKEEREDNIDDIKESENNFKEDNQMRLILKKFGGKIIH